MNPEVFSAFLIFIIAASFTPGPNNLMMMTSGSLFGWRATLPHILGVEIGFASLLMAVIFGADLIAGDIPWLWATLRIVGAIWLVWFGWQFVRSAFRFPQSTETAISGPSLRPLRFYEAFLFQWFNPKGMMMATSVAGSFVLLSPSAISRAAILGMTCALVGMLACFTWTLAGSRLAAFFQSGRSARVVQGIMGVLLILMAAMLLII